MKIGKIVNTNSKGQLVIPQAYRELYGITRDVPLNVVPVINGILIYPIKNGIPDISEDTSYAKVLERTTGAWRDDDFESTAKKRRELELKAAKRRQTAW